MINFCLPDFTLQFILLETDVFTDAKTALNTLRSFGLEGKHVVYIADQESNVCQGMPPN